MQRIRNLTYCLFLALCSSFNLTAQPESGLKVLRSIAMNASAIYSDEIGNIYVVKDKYTLLRYNSNGDSTAFYKMLNNGGITQIDVSNPLRIALYYTSFSKVTLLDRMLAPLTELNLSRINLLNPSVIASSADGNLWVYDRFNACLKKIDDQLQIIAQSNDLRLQEQQAPNPNILMERNKIVYLNDKQKGLYMFDRYGTYMNTLSIYDIEQLQVFGKQLVYRTSSKDTLYSYNLESLESQSIPLPGQDTPIINALISPQNLYVLYENKLVIYQYTH